MYDGKEDREEALSEKPSGFQMAQEDDCMELQLSTAHFYVSSLIWCLFYQHIESWRVVLVTHSQMMVLYRKGHGVVIGKLGLILFGLIRGYG